MRRPAGVPLGDFEHELIGALFQVHRHNVLVRFVSAVDIVSMHHGVIQPGLHTVIASQEQKSIAILRGDELCLQIGRTILLAWEQFCQVDAVFVWRWLPFHLLALLFGSEGKVEYGT